MTKSVPMLFAFVLLSVGPAACGGSARSTGLASRAASSRATIGGTAITTLARTSTQPSPRTDADGDMEKSNEYHHNSRYDDDDKQFLNFGHPASAVDRRAVADLVERYHKAAVAGDGAGACSLLYYTYIESIPEDYGKSPGPPSLRGKTCGIVLSKLFAQLHRELVTDAMFRLIGMRVRKGSGYALLSSGTRPPHYVPVRREYGAWKIATMRDIPLR